MRFVTVLLLLLVTDLLAQQDGQRPKPPVSQAVLREIIGPLETTSLSKPKSLVWVWGDDSAPPSRAHACLQVRDLMTGLLETVPKLTVETAYLFPSREQLERADLVVLYLDLPDLTDSQYADFQGYLERGGGVVALHASAVSLPASSGKRWAQWLGMAWDEGRSESGITDQIAIDTDHEIFQGFSGRLKIVDAFYSNLKRAERVRILGSVRTSSPGSSKSLGSSPQHVHIESPIFWTMEHGEGRVFATTIGQHTFTFDDPEFRIILFRSMAWAMREKADALMPLVGDGITDAAGMVGTTDAMRDSTEKVHQRLMAGSEHETFEFVQMCDTQLGIGGYEHDVKSFRRAVEQINALRPDFVFVCGDLVQNPDDRSFDDFNRIKTGFKVPCHCAAGNHDVENEPTVASLKRFREKVGPDYFVVEHQGYTFIVANTQLWKVNVPGESKRHDAWFKGELVEAKTKQRPVVVITHYPLFADNPFEGESSMNLPLEKRRELLSLFEEYGVVAHLAGHTHRHIQNDYKGIQMVTGETTSKNFDQRPLGFRLWLAEPGGTLSHRFIAVK